MNREEAIQEIIDIAKRYNLSLSEIQTALKAQDDVMSTYKKKILNHVFGYMGGLLIFAGIVIFIGMKWNDIHVFGQIFLTLGFGFCAFIMALYYCKQHLYESASTPLFLIAAILQPMGVVIFLQEYTKGTDPVKAALVISIIFLIQQGFTFLSTQRTVLLFTSLSFLYTALIATFNLLDVPYKTTWLTLSLSFLIISMAVNQTRHQPLAPLLFFISSVSFFWISFDLLEGKPYEILFLGISCLLIYAGIAIRSRMLLAISSISMLSYIGFFTSKHFPDTIGWPITLIIMGIILVFLSSTIIKIASRHGLGSSQSQNGSQ